MESEKLEISVATFFDGEEPPVEKTGGRSRASAKKSQRREIEKVGFEKKAGLARKSNSWLFLEGTLERADMIGMKRPKWNVQLVEWNLYHFDPNNFVLGSFDLVTISDVALLHTVPDETIEFQLRTKSGGTVRFLSLNVLKKRITLF